MTASRIEDVVERWLKDILRLPDETAAGYVSGSTAATIIGKDWGNVAFPNRSGSCIRKPCIFHDCLRKEDLKS